MFDQESFEAGLATGKDEMLLHVIRTILDLPQRLFLNTVDRQTIIRELQTMRDSYDQEEEFSDENYHGIY